MHLWAHGEPGQNDAPSGAVLEALVTYALFGLHRV